MDNNQDVMERLKKFVLAHPEMSKSGFLQGLDKKTGKIVIVVNGQEKRITIDELENGHLNEPEAVSNQVVDQPVNLTETQVPEEIEVMEDASDSVEVLSNDTPVEEISNNQIVTLKDMKAAIDSKNELAVDKALETFAVDNAGQININKAIKIVTDNCTNNVISCVRDNTSLTTDLSKYDVTSKPTVPFEPSQVKEELQSLVDKSFENILVYVEAARLKNIIFNEAQIENAKKKYATGIQDKINVLGLNKQEDKITPDNVKEEPKAMTLDLQPDKNIKKAGFADILILTIIVLIYAAIIINLITKLK